MFTMITLETNKGGRSGAFAMLSENPGGSMALLAWIAFPILAMAVMIFAGTQILYGLAFNLPWAAWNALAGRLRFQAVFLQAITPAFWIAFLAAVAYLGARFSPDAYAFFLNHPATRGGAALGAFWLLVGTFSTSGRQERAEDRLKFAQAFGRAREPQA